MFNPSKKNIRSGVVAVEAALSLPVLLIVFIGIVDCNRMYQTKCSMVQSAYEGGRLASQNGFTNQEIVDRSKQFLADRQIDAEVVVAPQDLSQVQPGQEVTVSISVQLKSIYSVQYDLNSLVTVLKE